MTNTFKLQFGTPHYKTTKDGIKTVTCSINCFLNLPLPVTQSLRKKYKEVTFSFIPSRDNILSSLAEIEVSGVAKCHPGDNFDFTIGKHISESKAKSKAYRLAKNILTDLISDYTVNKVNKNGKMVPSPVTIAKANCDKLASFYKDELEHISKLKS